MSFLEHFAELDLLGLGPPAQKVVIFMLTACGRVGSVQGVTFLTSASSTSLCDDPKLQTTLTHP